MRFEIASEVFEKLPTACFGVVAVSGVNNAAEYVKIEELLNAAIANSENLYKDVKIKESEAIAPYREAFRALDINPNKFMCSIEALLTRISKGKGMPKISPVVDLGNAVSLKYSLPIGAHDADTFTEVLEVRAAREGDSFIPFGGGEAEEADTGEIVYVSGGEIRTRRWTWRQSDIGKIHGGTNRLLYPIDGFSDINKAAVLAARDELAELLRTVFSAEVEIGFIDRENPVFESRL